ncbi:hypothetical protein ACGFNU_10735 [Spirillospora sp. NPDC048911]|uniref:hypothetical protein n=1 Tax=Spirillospora sp. NPDC048911 TaxID=3364527 RepID=UPI0037172640
MSNSYRSHHRRKKSSAGKVGLAGVLTGAIGIAAVAGGILILRPGSDGDAETTTSPPLSSQLNNAPAPAPAPKVGPALSITTPEGYAYSLAASRTGVDSKPLNDSTPAPAGLTYAYAEYVITNNQKRPVLLDFPADIFLPRAEVPRDAQNRCMPQAGIPAGMCTLPNHSKVTARLDDSEPPIQDEGDTLIPVGASYLVRIATDLPVNETLSTEDIKLYVWNARYTSDRKGIELARPQPAT